MADVVMETPNNEHLNSISIMPITSKTGLLPIAKKNVKMKIQETIAVEMPELARPAPFALRPFAGIYNPFPHGCSILCNHPADFEAKNVVKKAKDAWALEGKSLIDLDELSSLKLQEKSDQKKLLETVKEKNVKLPEELFRKYTDTDSRPLTPAPTLASIATKRSQLVRARRCVTPDPASFFPSKEKTLLILDLRRSHSQETVYWQTGQIGDANLEDEVYTAVIPSRVTTPSSLNTYQSKKKKIPRKKSTGTSGRTPSLKSENSKDSDSKVQASQSSEIKSLSKSSLNQESAATPKTPPISPQSSSGDLNVVKRRGKKRKGKKMGKDQKEDKEFKGIPDPGETQVSALENDSKEGSSRPSLTGEEKLQEVRQEEIRSTNQQVKSESLESNKSFLKVELLKQLQRQLDQEVVDSEMNYKRKIALEEALRCKLSQKQCQLEPEMKKLKNEFQLPIKNSEKWLSIPRVFTRRSARFELPMDSRLLKNMTPLQYVQDYVFVSSERLILYNHVFNLHKEEPEDDEEMERILLGKSVVPALGKIMGRGFTEQEAKDFQALIGWKDEATLDFRTFAGIGAVCERLLANKFCSKMQSQQENPRHEVERADFETLDGKLLRLNPDRRLVRILKSVKNS